MQKIPIIGFCFGNGLHWQSEGGKFSTKACFRLHIYLRTNKTLIHNYLQVFWKLGEKFKP